MRIVILYFCLFLMTYAGFAEEAKYDPTSSYTNINIEGWSVLVNRKLYKDKDPADKTIRLLKHQLFKVNRVVPEKALEELRKVPIWLEAESPTRCACYHPNRKWLEDNGFNPAKAKAIEIANPKNFLAWTKHQPYMLLHELAHAYHDRVLGWDDKRILEQCKSAMKTGKYEKVLNYKGKEVKHYAASNHKEYFAESTEAYFGRNDFYPFVNAELKKHDPEMHKLLGEIWGEGERGMKAES